MDSHIPIWVVTTGCFCISQFMYWLGYIVGRHAARTAIKESSSNGD